MRHYSSKTSRLLFFCSSFFLQGGSHFFTLALSSYIYVLSKSPIQAALVMVFSFLPATFFSVRLGQLVDQKTSRGSMLLNLCLSFSMSLLCCLVFTAWPNIYAQCLLLGARSLSVFTTRGFLTKWIKIYAEQKSQEKSIKIFYLTYFLSSVGSGILVGHFLKYQNVYILAAMEGVLLLTGLALFARLPFAAVTQEIRNQTQGNKEPFSAVLQQIASAPNLKVHFSLVCIATLVFQAAYSALVTNLPLRYFSLGAAGVGKFQVAASIGIVCGFLVIWLWPNLLQSKRNYLLPISISIFLGLSCLFAIAVLSYQGSVSIALVAFMALCWIFEVLWLYSMSKVFTAAASSSIGTIQFLLNTLSSLLMSLNTLAYAIFIEYFSLVPATVCFCLTSFVLSMAVIFGLSPNFLNIFSHSVPAANLNVGERLSR